MSKLSKPASGKKVFRIAFFFAFLGKFVLILAKGNNTGNSFRIVNIFKVQYPLLPQASAERKRS